MLRDLCCLRITRHLLNIVVCITNLDAMFVARFVAAAYGMVAERATLLCNKLRSKVAQQKSRVSSALAHALRRHYSCCNVNKFHSDLVIIRLMTHQTFVAQFVTRLCN